MPYTVVPIDPWEETPVGAPLGSLPEGKLSTVIAALMGDPTALASLVAGKAAQRKEAGTTPPPPPPDVPSVLPSTEQPATAIGDTATPAQQFEGKTGDFFGDLVTTLLNSFGKKKQTSLFDF